MDAAEHLDVLSQRRHEAVRLEVGGAQLEHERAHLGPRFGGQPAHLGQLLACGRRVAVDQLGRRLGGEGEREERLGDGVVQVAGQPVSLLDHRELAAALVHPGGRDGHGGVGGEELDQLLVGVRELVRADLVGQVEGARDLACRHDRDAQERRHPRVGRRPPFEARVAGDVGRAVRQRPLEHGAEQAVRARERADRGDQLVAHPGRDEVREAAVSVGDADGGVAAARQPSRRLHQAAQRRLERRRNGDCGDRLADCAKRRSGGLSDRCACGPRHRRGRAGRPRDSPSSRCCSR